MNTLSMKPFSDFSKKWALVSAGTAEASNTMTVSWGGVGVLWGKNVVFIFVRESRYTKDFVDSGCSFSLAFLGEEYRDALRFCGTETGRGRNKWACAGLTPAVKGEIVYPAEAERVFLCRKLAAVPITDANMLDESLMPRWYADHDMHTMYVGEILEVLEQ